MEHINLTTAEWAVMECLWQHSTQTGRELAQAMEAQQDWSRSTTLTLLRRMESKGAIASETCHGLKTFSPKISREETALQETENFLSRVYQGSLSMMVNAFTKKQNLSPSEIQELQDILKGLE